MSDMRFLRTTEVIERLRAKIRGMGKKIGGANDPIDSKEDKARLTPPCLYVGLGTCTSTVDSDQGSIQMIIRHEFNIILHLDNTDRRGQYADVVSTKIRIALLRVLAGWLPDQSLSTSASVNCHSSMLAFAGDDLIRDDRAGYFRSYIFFQNYTFDSSEDALGMLGNYDDLDDFDELCQATVINTDPNVKDVKIELTGIHE